MSVCMKFYTISCIGLHFITTFKINHKSKNYKLLRRKQRYKSLWPCTQQWFLRYDTKSTINCNKWIRLLKLKTCASVHMIKKVKRQPIEWEQLFTNKIFAKRFVSKIYKGVLLWQWIKDHLILSVQQPWSLLWYGFNPGLGTSTWPWAWKMYIILI